MKTVTLYGLSKCSTCIKAMAWLDDHGTPYEFVDYREQPIAASQLQKWSRELGGWEKLVNRASMTWRNLSDSRKAPESDAQWAALVAEFPALVRRPVMVDAKGAASVGFSDTKYSELLGA
ncbi:MAG: Spx/MgsR family RNA polymerase-binding regulatory protein [Candidimonas sp.]|nr:MAG: Spx/MgsR family RNA polymerase-binding regulatory protein [Candidimonas sp.]TAM25012.1 MAG: Spx/MgsR family RNA polymerase-binding regulatory protein [Candidimonas sp.]TAM73829.1 MAG: Spx/MgsR family RNA polymerase-binding regulatory protein [Candidimonas sp.]